MVVASLLLALLAPAASLAERSSPQLPTGCHAIGEPKTWMGGRAVHQRLVGAQGQKGWLTIYQRKDGGVTIVRRLPGERETTVERIAADGRKAVKTVGAVGQRASPKQIAAVADGGGSTSTRRPRRGAEPVAGGEALPPARPGFSPLETIAVAFVKARMQALYDPAKYEIKVSPRESQFLPTHYPITGSDKIPVSVDVTVTSKTRPGLLKRVAQCLGFNKKRYYVQATAGRPEIVGEASMNVFARLDRRLPISEKLHDLLHSEGARRGFAAAVAGALVSGPSPAAAGALLAFAVMEIGQGLQRRSEARKNAVAATADWARETMSGGPLPTAAQAFERYKLLLDEAKPGTNPGTMRSFLQRLSLHGL
jgi:hypothetical protein